MPRPAEAAWEWCALGVTNRSVAWFAAIGILPLHSASRRRRPIAALIVFCSSAALCWLRTTLHRTSDQWSLLRSRPFGVVAKIVPVDSFVGSLNRFAGLDMLAARVRHPSFLSEARGHVRRKTPGRNVGWTSLSFLWPHEILCHRATMAVASRCRGRHPSLRGLKPSVGSLRRATLAVYCRFFP
jgi:hypothetical protein